MKNKNERNEDVTFSNLISFYSNLELNGEYADLFDAAFNLTSKSDPRRNQTIKYLRQAQLFNCIRDVLDRKISGQFAECGCFRGQASHMLASMIQQNGKKNKKLHLFDSFEGLSDFLPADNKGHSRSDEQIGKMKKHFSIDENTVRKNLNEFDFIEYHKGWIPDRFSDVVDQTFCLVHVDVDLYQPTLHSIEFFYPRMVTGGWILIDDYNAKSYPGANKAVDDFVRAVNPITAIALQCGGYMIQAC